MTVSLPAALAEIAAQAPGLRLPPDLWERGRRRRRVRFWRRLPAALLGLISAWLLLSGPAGQVGSSDGIVLPRSFAEPHLWQQTLDGDTNGPILLRFTTGHSLNLETADVYIGRDGSYRIDYLNPGGEGDSLSADGRYMIGTDIRDLATGQHRPLDRPVWAAWSRSADGKTAIGALDHDDPVISYGPDGRS